MAPDAAAAAAGGAVLYAGIGQGYGNAFFGEPVPPDPARVAAFASDGGWGALSKVQELVLPGAEAVEWVEMHPSGGTLYAFLCFWKFKPARLSDEAPGQVIAYRVDAATGQLSPRGPPMGSGGLQPCHAAVSPAGDRVAVAHYLCGTIAVWSADPATGELSGAAPARTLAMPWVVPEPSGERVIGEFGVPQPLAHGVTWSPDGSWLLGVDAGQGQIAAWEGAEGAPRLTRLLGRSKEADEYEEKARPRHCVFSSDGSAVHVLFEMSSDVASYAFDASTGGVGDGGRPLGDCRSTLADPGGAKPGESGFPPHCAGELLLVRDIEGAREGASRGKGVVAATNRAIGAFGGTEATAALFDEAAGMRPAGAPLPAGQPTRMGDARHALALPARHGGGMLVACGGSGDLIHYAPRWGDKAAPLRHVSTAAGVADALCVAVRP